MGKGRLRRVAKKEMVHGILVEKCQGSRPLGRRRHKWQDNFTMDLRQLNWLRMGPNGGIS